MSMNGRLTPTEVRALRASLTRRTRIPKRDLTELAQALMEFEKLPEHEKEWVRQAIEEHDKT